MAANYEMNKITKKGWTKQPNAILHDENLTSDAKVVIYELLSVSGDYNINMKGISKATHLSESKVQRAVALLQDTGYLRIVKVRNGKYFSGYKWLISDTSGTYRKYTDSISMDGISKDGISIPATSNYGISNDDISIYEKFMDAPLYEYTERYEHTNYEEQNFQQTELNEERENEEALSPIPSFQSKVDSSLCSSSEANASPLNSKNRGVTQVITQSDLNIEQAFNRFCEVYPRVGDIEQARTAFFAIPDIDKICQQIANSVEWFEKNGRWNDWATGQKNVSCPQAVKFLTRGDWKEYLKSGATVSEEERLRTILAKSRQTNIFGGSEYGING